MHLFIYTDLSGNLKTSIVRFIANNMIDKSKMGFVRYFLSEASHIVWIYSRYEKNESVDCVSCLLQINHQLYWRASSLGMDQERVNLIIDGWLYSAVHYKRSGYTLIIIL